MSAARDAALLALTRLRESGASFNDSAAGLPEVDGLDERDRRLANELVVGVVKRRLSLDAVLAGFVHGQVDAVRADLLDVLRLATYQLVFLDRVPGYAAVDEAVAAVADAGARRQGFVNAVLRRVSADGRERFDRLAGGHADEDWAVRHSMPRWLVALLRDDLGDADADALLSTANLPAERCVRANPLRGTAEQARASLLAEGYEAATCADVPGALTLRGGPPLERSAAMRNGLVTAQSRGSQLVGAVAPGTKTAQLAALLPAAQVTAVDVDAQRVAALTANLARLGVTGVDVECMSVETLAAEGRRPYDAILVDAPCSGLGTLASRPDLRWRRRASDVVGMAARQGGLVDAAARLTGAGGHIVYAVCTLTRAETLDVVEAFLARHRGWVLEDLGAEWPRFRHPVNGACLRTLPPDDGSSGFFVARLLREASPS